ncbi:MAG: VOC family protein, partial [Candidatus Binatia bacterium]
MEFGQPVIVVEKLAECVRFYRDLMGCEMMAGGEEGPVAYFASGGQRFALLDSRARPAEMARGGDARLGAPRVTLAFHAANVDAEFERLRAAGVPFTIEPRDFPE